MQLKIRDYRGVERADIELDRIALIAGQNEMGKTCVAEAARAALCGMAIPIHGVLKKDAKLLVRDGAESGSVNVTNGEFSQGVNWPGAICTGDGETECTDYASGFLHLLDQPVAGRAQALRTYINSDPTQEDVEAAAKDAGYQDSAITKIWESVRDDGWDVTYQRARDYTVKLKGQWEEATGEKKYGAKKAADWKPPSLDSVLSDAINRDTLVSNADSAEQAVLNAAGAVAVSDAEIERLNRQVAAESEAENQIKLNDELSDIRASLDTWQADRETMPDDPAETPAGLRPAKAACPECSVVLVLNYPRSGPPYLTTFATEEAPKPLSDEVLAKRASMDESIEQHKAEIAALEGRITASSNVISTAETARTRLKEIAKAPKLDEAAIQEAKDKFSDAQTLVFAFDAKVRADKLHGDLVKNDKLLAVLAPDGLRRRKLASKLDEFNARLATICASAAWPVVRLDEKLEGHYGTRPIWGASKSGQWRARTVLQIALTQIDGSAAVLLDEADMLDTRGRNGLFNALKASGLRAIVCMTFSKREKVPDLAALGDGFGHSYWIEGGVAEAINHA